MAVSKARKSNQLGEIIAESTADIGVSGVYNKLSEYDPSPSSRQVEENSGILPGTDSIQGDYCQKTDLGDRETNCSSKNSAPSTVTLSSSAKTEGQGSTTGQIELRNSDHPRWRMCRGTEMVDRVNHPVKWQINDQTKPADYHYRCLQEWFGGGGGGGGDSRFMDRNQETTAHKRSPDESNDVRSEGIYHGQEKLSCSGQNRQHNSNSLLIWFRLLWNIQFIFALKSSMSHCNFQL